MQYESSFLNVLLNILLPFKKAVCFRICLVRGDFSSEGFQTEIFCRRKKLVGPADSEMGYLIFDYTTIYLLKEQIAAKLRD